MPWHDRVKAVVQAWYPGQAGGRAIAEVLAGEINPSGHLPMTFPVDLDQTPRPELEVLGAPLNTPVTIDYHEGAEVGYRWFAQTGDSPRYAFGHGLSYTNFRFDEFSASGGDTVTAEFTVTNIGDRAGADVAQVYLTHVDGTPRQRLIAFERVELAPNESRRVRVTPDRRFLGRYDVDAGSWLIDAGTYRIALSHSAVEEAAATELTLTRSAFGR